MTVFSKPRIPLGCVSFNGSRPVLFPELEDEADPTCGISLNATPWRENVDCVCSHSFCLPCLTDYYKTIFSGGRDDFRCPLCRAAHGGRAKTRDLEIGSNAEIVFFEDALACWHVIGAESESGRFLASSTPRRRKASTLCWIDPYGGWIIQNGQPDHAARFTRCGRTSTAHLSRSS